MLVYDTNAVVFYVPYPGGFFFLNNFILNSVSDKITHVGVEITKLRNSIHFSHCTIHKLVQH